MCQLLVMNCNVPTDICFSFEGFSAHLVDRDLTVDFAELTTPSDRVAVIATSPLTDNERWTPIEPGRIVAFRDGAPVQL
jgi:glutamine amidotransferase